MNPYYQENGITIYHGDCREVLPSLPKVDLVLTDPPYGLQWWGGTGFKKVKHLDWQEICTWDFRPTNETLNLCKTAGSNWIIWGGNYFASALGDCRSPLVWDKETGANPFADGEMAFTSFTSGTLRIFRHQWRGALKDSERGVVNFLPTQKPVTLMAWCIKLAGNPQLILDPFMGSGTTLRAAKNMGRRAIGIEIEERYCEIAANRLRQEVLAFA